MRTDRLLPVRPAAPLALLLPLAAACHAHHHDHDEPASPPVFGEQEPNDWADHPDHIGGLGSTSHLFVVGHVHDHGPDLYDGFHFVATEPCTIQFALDAHAPADLDLAVYDPFVGDFVLYFESPYDPETGSFVVFDAGTEFHLVVRSFQGSSDYSLELIGGPPEMAPMAEEPPVPGSIARRSIAPRAAAPAGETRLDTRALFGGYRPAPPPPEPEDERAPALWIRYDDHGRILEVVPVLLTAGGAVLGLRPPRPSVR